MGGFNYKGLPSELNLYLKVRNSGNTKNTWHWLTSWKPSSKKQLLKVLKRWQHILYDGKIFNKTVACHPHDNKNKDPGEEARKKTRMLCYLLRASSGRVL